MLWLAVPVVLAVGAVGVLAAIRSLERSRRALQHQIAALADARAAISPVQRRVDATRAAAVARSRR